MNGNLNVQSLALHNHSLKRWLVAALCLVLALPMVAGLAAYRWAESIPQRANEQQTIVIGQNRLVPDSDASLRVVVQRLSDGGPIAGAEVKVGLTQPSGEVQPLYSGQTDETGSLPVHFHVPADAPATAQLVVETRSASGQDQLVQPVTIQRDYRLLLSTDKPLYQSGQTIHMRVLALSDFDLAPARGQPLDFTVQDPKGNKVYRERVNSSEFGIAAADFMLADRVNQGNYKLTVAMGDVTSEKTVEVRPYALPKFDLKVSTDRSYYLPGQRVAGAVQADYFFGKPVAHGQVQIVGSVWDVERAVTVELTGETDENGTYAFAFDLPQYLAGSGLDAGQARFALEVTLVDQTDHVEQTSQVLPIAAQPLIIEAIPESGLLKPGVENRVYILTSYPDGRPAPTRLQVRVENVDDEPRELIGGEYGLTEYAFVPQAGKSLRLYIAAEDETGLSAKRWVLLGVEQSSGDTVLLRADRATYVVGETMHLAALTPVEYGDVYLDITKQGQTLSTRSTAVEDGLAQFVVDVSADMYGTLELHAYKVLPDGTIVRDTRLVVVDAPTALDIAVSADRDVYRPGDLATLAFQTSDAQDGTGVQTALGVALVDESVFALQSQDPGFAKLYFLLEQQLMEPFYQIRSDDGSAFLPAEHPSGSRVRSAQDSAAKAMWAEESPSILRPVNSRAHKMAAIQLAQRKALRQTSYAFASVLLLLPLGLWAVAFVALWRAGVLQRAIKRVLLVIAALLFLGSYASCGFGALTVPLFHDNVQGLFTLLSVLFGLGSIALVAHALVKRDPAAALLTLLTLTWGTILFLQIQLFGHKAMPSGLMVVVLASSFLLVSGSYILFGQGRWTQERRFAGATATGMGAMWAIVLVPVLIVVLSGCMAQTAVVETAKEVTRVVEKEVAISVTATPAPGVDQASGTEAPRLRQYFPETLYWTPEVVTDEDGFVALDIATADSITTWRMTVLASSQDGRLGYTTRGVRVFQGFFVDIDLPMALTQGDEIGIPVGVYNYLPGPQEVRLEVKQEPWFELLDEPERTLVVEANDIEVAYFAVRVREFGRQGFQVTAWGDTAHSAGVSDAIRREVNVLPDGKEFRLAESDWLRENKTIALHVPPQASPGTAHVEVKIYPGVMAQAIEGLEKILRKPNGCFEQTTSTTYPNLLVLDYMQRTGSGSPEVQVQAERFAGAGYQRLLTFEVPGGGFSLFGRPPARPFLTAYGLMEFHDMANVYPVDEDLIARTAQWLLEQQGADGTWSDSGQSEHWHIASKVPTTAYIAWTLIEAGYGHTPQVGHAVAYLRESAAEIQDAYSLALVANALVAYDDDSAATQEILDRLYERRIDQQDEDPSATGVYWPAGAPSLMGAAGTSGSLETTALAAIAFTRAHVHLDAVNGALAYLIQGKDSWGTWQTTQATVLSLKALLLASEGNRQADGPATVYVSLNGEQTKQITIDEVNADAVHLVAFDRGFSPDGANQVLIEVETGTTAESSERAGGGNLMYQVATSYYLPWNRVPPSAKAEEAISIDLQYDRTTMAVNDEVTVYVDVQLNREGIVRNALIDLGVPPGFSVLSEGLSKLVQEERIARYELAGRQIIIYLENFSSEMPLAFSYRLRARFPMRAQTPPSSAYDYYNPEELSVRAPIEIAVIE